MFNYVDYILENNFKKHSYFLTSDNPLYLSHISNCLLLLVKGLELTDSCRGGTNQLSENSECILVWTSECGTRAKESDSNH